MEGLAFLREKDAGFGGPYVSVDVISGTEIN